MSAPRCACGQPAPHSVICTACERDLTAALAAVAVLAPELDTTLVGAYARRTGHILAAVYAHTTPLPYDERASEGLQQLRAVLSGWVRVLAETLTTGWPHDTLPAMARYLLGHIADIRRHEAAGDIHREVTAAVRRAWVVIDNPAPRVYAGPCPHCATDLLSRPARTHVTCAGCGTTHNIAERQDSMRTQLDDYLGTATYAAAILPGIGIHVTESVIRGWAFRHRLEVRAVVPPRYNGQSAQPLYRLGDIVDLALERDAKARLAAWVSGAPPVNLGVSS